MPAPVALGCVSVMMVTGVAGEVGKGVKKGNERRTARGIRRTTDDVLRVLFFFVV